MVLCTVFQEHNTFLERSVSRHFAVDIGQEIPASSLLTTRNGSILAMCHGIAHLYHFKHFHGSFVTAFNGLLSDQSDMFCSSSRNHAVDTHQICINRRGRLSSYHCHQFTNVHSNDFPANIQDCDERGERSRGSSPYCIKQDSKQ